jgi:hypothetical protein
VLLLNIVTIFTRVGEWVDYTYNQRLQIYFCQATFANELRQQILNPRVSPDSWFGRVTQICAVVSPLPQRIDGGYDNERGIKQS